MADCGRACHTQRELERKVRIETKHVNEFVLR
jgi:hypothetical protein